MAKIKRSGYGPGGRGSLAVYGRSCQPFDVYRKLMVILGCLFKLRQLLIWFTIIIYCELVCDLLTVELNRNWSMIHITFVEWSRTSVVTSLVCFYCSTNIVNNKFIKQLWIVSLWVFHFGIGLNLILIWIWILIQGVW